MESLAVKVAVRMLVSASEVVVEVEGRFGLRSCNGLGTSASGLVVLADERLVGAFSSETRRSWSTNGA